MVTKHYFSCPKCDQQCRWEEDLAGHRVKCRRCRNKIRVPERLGPEPEEQPLTQITPDGRWTVEVDPAEAEAATRDTWTPDLGDTLPHSIGQPPAPPVYPMPTLPFPPQPPTAAPPTANAPISLPPNYPAAYPPPGYPQPPANFASGPPFPPSGAPQLGGPIPAPLITPRPPARRRRKPAGSEGAKLALLASLGLLGTAGALFVAFRYLLP